VPFRGAWSVRPLGGDRVELTVSVGRQSTRETLRLLADDAIYNEAPERWRTASTERRQKR
jgi:hypothetical protein